MNHKNDDEYEEEEEEEDDIGEDLEELRRACIIPDPNSVSIDKFPSDDEDDSENEDDHEMLKSIKTQLAPMGLLSSLSVISDSDNEDDFEMLKSIKSQLAMPIIELQDDDDDDAFTLEAIRKRFSTNFDMEGNLMNDDSTGKINKQVHLSDNEQSSEILNSSNHCESFPDTEQVVEDVDLHEKTLEASQSSASSSFPESAQALVDAIRKNRSYQKFLHRKLTEIEVTIEQNRKHRKNVMIVKDFQASCERITKQALTQRKDPRVELISTRKDSSQGNDKTASPLTFGPPENSCVANYRMALERYPISVDRKSWTAKEKESLVKGVKQQVQTALIQASEGSTDDTDTILESVKNLEITPEIVKEFISEVKWDQLDVKNRSGAECEARWMSSEDPLINHGPWTAEEDRKLLSVIQEKGLTEWCDIAESLGTNRTPFKCLERYQRSLNPDILARDWTPEEDEQLRAAVDLFGEKDWQSVAHVLQTRTGTQCSNRWMKSLHPTKTKEGDWSSREEKCLKVAVTFFGAKNWPKIAQFVPGRTDVQCREKWKYSFDPKLKRGGWSEEEDAKLREATEVHGYSNWAKVAVHVPGRDRKQCRRRWNYLNPHVAPLIQEAKRLRKEATVGNFVDRESERPPLVACDFMALAEISLEAEQPGIVAPKRKRRATKSDGSALERQPKRRRKGLEGSLENETVSENEPNNEGEVMYFEWRNEIQENVAEPSSDSSVITTNCPQGRSGIQKLKPRRKVSTVVSNQNQDAPNLKCITINY